MSIPLARYVCMYGTVLYKYILVRNAAGGGSMYEGLVRRYWKLARNHHGGRGQRYVNNSSTWLVSTYRK
jgi:hypothetical protein